MNSTKTPFSRNEAMNASSSVRRNPIIIGCSSSRFSPAAERIANNTDLLTEILVCLPATSLIRFKSVSKHWLSLISDSRFTAIHNARNPRPSAAGLFLRRNGWSSKSMYVSLQGHSNPPKLAFLDVVAGAVKPRPTIMDSSCGLLLCHYSYMIPGSGVLTSYIVCNPTTRSYKFLPSRPFACMLRAFLAFDPLKSPYHKVVVMGGYGFVQIDIYFSESSSWKKFHPPGLRDLKHEVLCGSVIHWISDGNVIVGFDIDSKKMLELPDPPRIDRVENIKYFGECGGRLTLIESDMPSAVAFRILEMDKDYGGWIVKFQVNLGPLLSEFLELESTIHNYSILFVLEGEKEKDYGLVLATRRKVISYNPRSETLNVLQEDPLSHFHPYKTCPFVASLFPI